MRWKIKKNHHENLYLLREGIEQPIYSERNPVESGERFCNMFSEKGGIYIIIGIGYFYHILPFIKDKSIEKIIILEPDENLIELINDREFFKNLIRDSRVLFIGGHDKVNNFIEKLKGNYELLFYDRINVVVFPTLERLLPDIYGKIKSEVNNSISELLKDGVTIAKFAKRWLLNFRNNIDFLSDSFSLPPLRDLYRGDCIVAAAGPGLNMAIKYLKSIERRKIFIISVDASVRPLILSGIIPDLVVSIDPQPYIRFHFFGVEKQLKEVPILLSPMSSYEVFKLFKKRYIFSNRYPLSYIINTGEGMNREIFNFQSVSSLAVKIAEYLGFKNIYLAGFDFSFRDYFSYARDTFFYRYNLARGYRYKSLLTSDVEFMVKKLESRLSTLEPMDLQDYKRELVQLINEIKLGDKDIKFYNLFPKSVEIKGTKGVNNVDCITGYSLSGKPDKRKIMLKSNDLDDYSKKTVILLALYYRLIKGVKIDIAYRKAVELSNRVFSQLKFKLNLQLDKV